MRQRQLLKTNKPDYAGRCVKSQMYVSFLVDEIDSSRRLPKAETHALRIL